MTREKELERIIARQAIERDYLTRELKLYKARWYAILDGYLKFDSDNAFKDDVFSEMNTLDCLDTVEKVEDYAKEWTEKTDGQER
jgi:hypothetical protein